MLPTGGRGKSSVVRFLRNGFSEEKRLHHFLMHKDEFDVTSVADYERLAIEFRNRRREIGIESFISERGSTYMYEAATNTFLIHKSDGLIVTFFKPDNGVQYWNEQKEMYDIRG